jgi:acetyl esterase/lipase
MVEMTLEMIIEDSKIRLDISGIPLRTYLDIPYAEGGKAHQLDIALPKEGSGPFPVVVFIHGGAWYYGDKRNVHTGAAWNTIPSAGFALVSVNYRLTQEAAWPAQIHDCKAAIRFVREHAQEYNLDVERIGVWGNSSGGQLAGVLAATGGNPAYEDLSMGCPRASSTVQAACIWYGIFDFASIQSHWKRILKPGETLLPDGYNVTGSLLYNPAVSLEQNTAHASSINQVHDNMPPMLLFHGTGDRVVPYLQSVEFFEKYLLCNPHDNVHMELFENAPHGGPAFINERNLKNVQDFFKKWLVNKTV